MPEISYLPCDLGDTLAMAENVDMHSLLKRLPEVGYLAPH